MYDEMQRNERVAGKIMKKRIVYLECEEIHEDEYGNTHIVLNESQGLETASTLIKAYDGLADGEMVELKWYVGGNIVL